MHLALRFRESADPALTLVVAAMTPKDVMDEIDELERVAEMLAPTGASMEREQDPHGEGIGPQVAPARIAVAIEAGAIGEGVHEPFGVLRAFVDHELRRGAGRCTGPHRRTVTATATRHEGKSAVKDSRRRRTLRSRVGTRSGRARALDDPMGPMDLSPTSSSGRFEIRSAISPPRQT